MVGGGGGGGGGVVSYGRIGTTGNAMVCGVRTFPIMRKESLAMLGKNQSEFSVKKGLKNARRGHAIKSLLLEEPHTHYVSIQLN